jgi:hypothetical protein
MREILANKQWPFVRNHFDSHNAYGHSPSYLVYDSAFPRMEFNTNHRFRRKRWAPWFSIANRKILPIASYIKRKSDSSLILQNRYNFILPRIDNCRLLFPISMSLIGSRPFKKYMMVYKVPLGNSTDLLNNRNKDYRIQSSMFILVKADKILMQIMLKYIKK